MREISDKPCININIEIIFNVNIIELPPDQGGGFSKRLIGELFFKEKLERA